MTERFIIKNEAKKILSENLWKSVFVVLILSAIPWVVSMIGTVIKTAMQINYDWYTLTQQIIRGTYQPTVTFWLITSIFTLVDIAVRIAIMSIQLSVLAYFISLAAGKKGDLNIVRKTGRFFESFSLYLLIGVKVFLWTLLLIIPGIIKSFSYFAAPYLKYKNPDKNSFECIEESKRVMNGYKATLFIHYLSFIGWYILIGLAGGLINWLPVIGPVFSDIIIFGCGLIVQAYLSISLAIFYRELTAGYHNLTNAKAEGGSEKIAVFEDYGAGDGKNKKRDETSAQEETKPVMKDAAESEEKNIDSDNLNKY